MSVEEKAFFKDCSMKEKFELGTNYRRNRKKKDNKTTKKTSRKVKVTSGEAGRKEVKEKEGSETDRFLVQLQLSDLSIEEALKEGKVLCEELACEKIESAVMKFKLKMKTEELAALKDKYEQLVMQ